MGLWQNIAKIFNVTSVFKIIRKNRVFTGENIPLNSDLAINAMWSFHFLDSKCFFQNVLTTEYDIFQTSKQMINFNEILILHV